MAKDIVTLARNAGNAPAQIPQLNATASQALTLDWSAQTVTLNANTWMIQITCPSWNTWPVYVRSAISWTVSSSDFDAIVLPWQTIHRWIPNEKETEIGVLWTSTETAYIIQY